MRAISIVVALCLAGCAAKGDTRGQVSRGFYSPDFDTLWEVGERTMIRSKFTPDSESSSKEARSLVSRWENNMSPFSGRGYRERATLTFHEVPGQPSRWTVEANVTREANMAMVAPSNPIVAKWENPVRVPEKENLLTREVEAFFVPRDVSPEFRSRYRMGRSPNEPETPQPVPDDAPKSPHTR